jgi:thioester reductase-like protein
MSESFAKSQQDVVNVFLTGVTGFLGKVILEEIFRRRAEYKLGEVFILTRAKRGEDPESRFREQIVTSPCFRDLPKDWIKDVRVIEGDVSEDLCGIDPAIYKEICTKLTHIIHCAGSISFTLPIKEAAHTNVGGTMNVFGLAKNCLALQRLVATSTAYTMPDSLEAIHEDLPPLPY